MKTLTSLCIVLFTTIAFSLNITGQERKIDYEINEFLPISEGEIVKHKYFTLAYSEEHEQAKWVFYKLTPLMTNGGAMRSNKFTPDPLVSTTSSQLSDYTNSGYDRGHLCPAASMSIDQTAMDESFFMSNMSPQEPSFNRGAWKKLEENVRYWANTDSLIYVITGPILENKTKTIGINQVTVPDYYYKIVYSPNQNKMIGFIMPNRKIEESIKEFIVPVDSIENRTKIDFFSQLDDESENILESTSDSNLWDFNVKITEKKETRNQTNNNVQSNQCKGISKSTGERCKIMTSNPNGYCRYHQNQADK